LKTSKNIYKNTLGYVLTLYITSNIIFFQNYIGITYFLSALLIALFFFLTTIKKTPRLKSNSVIKLYGALSLLAIASSFWAVNFDLSAKKGFQMVYILINMFILYNAIKIYHLEKYFLYGIFLGALANYIFLLGFYSPPFEIFLLGRALGSMGNANVLALLMNFSIFASILYFYLYRPKRFFLLYLSTNVFLALYIIFITASKKGLILATLLIAMFLLMNIKNIKNIVFMSIFIVVAVVIMQNTVNQAEFFDQLDLITKRFGESSDVFQGKSQYGSTGYRLNFIKLGVRLFTERSVLGYGVDNFRLFGRTYSHNNYIEVLVGLGLVGFTILMSIYFSVLYKISKIRNKYIKYNLFTLMIGLIVLDLALVSYSAKIILFFLIFLSIIAEKNQKTPKLNE
jgi:O-antigen ligase